jgi:hypothetical protein
LTKNPEKIYVIACKILSRDVQKAAKKANINADIEFLPLGLHETPSELTREVQKTIDKASDSGTFSRIVLGYGICGKGTEGLKAAKIPLVLPQAHDCITLFLGSDSAYKEQFSSCPGTYYFTAGWFDENPNYQETLRIGLNIEKFGKTYKPQDLEIIEKFLAGWQKNYTRAVFVRNADDTGDDKYRQITKEIAQKYGWKYQELTGDTRLLEKLLVAQKSDDEILLVPPGFTVVFNALTGKLETTLVKE